MDKAQYTKTSINTHLFNSPHKPPTRMQAIANNRARSWSMGRHPVMARPRASLLIRLVPHGPVDPPPRAGIQQDLGMEPPSLSGNQDDIPGSHAIDVESFLFEILRGIRRACFLSAHQPAREGTNDEK
jgi:hypothetical protein